MEHAGHDVAVCTIELVSVTYAARVADDSRVATDWEEVRNEIIETQEERVFCYQCQTMFNAEVVSSREL